MAHRESDGRGPARQPRRVPLAARRHRRPAQPDRPLTGVVASTPAAATRAPTCCSTPSTRWSRVTGRTAYPEAVRIGLEQVPADAAEWVWLLHDDANPAPDALERLLARGRGRPAPPTSSAPSCASGPRCKRLLEVGVTISRHRPARDRPRARRVRPGPARRGPRGARGQHRRHAGAPPRCSTTSAASTTTSRCSATTSTSAGARPRPAYRTVVVPAGGRLPRRGRAPRRPAYAADRPAHPLPGAPGRALHAAGQRPGPAAALAGRSACFFGTLLRMVGFLVVRSVGRGARRPRRAGLRLRQPRPDPAAPGRRARRGPASTTPTPLLAPWWVPYRHGLDFVGDLAAAATNQAQDVADRRRAAKEAAAPAPLRRPVVSRRRGRRRPRTPGWSPASSPTRSPSRWASSWCSSIVGVREAFGSVDRRRAGPGAGRRRERWWRLWIEPWHPLGTGTAVPAPAYVVPMAVLGVGARQQRLRRGLRGAPARRTAGAVGRLAAPARGRPAGRPGRLAALAGGARGGDLRAGAGRPPAPGATAGSASSSAAVLLPWLAHAALGFADPERRPALARRLAHRPAAGARRRRSRRSPGSSPSSWPLVVTALAVAITRSLPARPRHLGPARGRARRDARCCSRRGGCRPSGTAPARCC